MEFMPSLDRGTGSRSLFFTDFIVSRVKPELNFISHTCCKRNRIKRHGGSTVVVD